MHTDRPAALAACLVALYFLGCAVVCSPPATAAYAGERLLGASTLLGQSVHQLALRDEVSVRVAAVSSRYSEAPTPEPWPDDLPPAIAEHAATSADLDLASFQPCPGVICYHFAVTRTAARGEALADLETLVFDLGTGRAIDISDVLKPSQAAIEQVSGLAYTGLVEALSLTEDDDLAVIRQATGPYLGNFARFALTEYAIVFYFPPCHLGAWAEETLAVSIAYLDLVEALNIRVGYTREDGRAVCAYIDVPGGPVSGWEDGQPAVALTFDDGPHPEHTRLILEELSRHHAVATFCVIGATASRNSELLREIVLQGSEIGNHTWTHQDLTKLTPAQVTAEVERTQRFLETVTGRRPTFLRPPAGAVNSRVIQAAGLPIVLWSVDPKDWLGGDAASVAAHIIEKARGGDIILQHDSRISSYQALGAVLDELAARGYRFVTVSELLGLGVPESPQRGVFSRLKDG